MYAQSPLAPLAAKIARHVTLSDEETRAFLAMPHRLAELRRGDRIVREGDVATQCCAMLSGFSYTHKGTGEDKRQILSVHLRGDLPDLHNCLVELADHALDALTDAEVAFIPRRAILDVAAAYPNVGRALWKETVIDGSISREWLANIGHRNARQRVAHLLCELAVRQTVAGVGNEPQYAWPMTQEQIGEAMGLTPVHVNRTMQRLRSDGLLKTGGRMLTILDWPGLQDAGDFDAAYLHLTGNPLASPASAVAA